MPALWLLAASGIAHADTVATEPAPTTTDAVSALWQGRINLGFFDQSGNISNKRSLTFKMDIQRQWNKFVLENRAEVVSASDDNAAMSSERYLLVSKQRLNINDVNYTYLQQQFERDSNSEFGRQFSLTAGLGKSLVKRTAETLSLEAGAGVRYSERKVGKSDASPVLTTALHYHYKLNERASFQQRLSAEVGTESNIYRSLTELNMQLHDALGLALGYDVKREVSDKTQRLNLTTISLTYTY